MSPDRTTAIRHARGLAVSLLALAAGLAAPAVPVAAATGENALDQNVTETEEVAVGQTVIEVGHVDIGPRLREDGWQLYVRDDAQAPPVWRTLEDVVLRLGGASILPAPEDEQFSFIDAEPGTDLYVVPQTQDYDVVWVGWNSQDPPVVDQLAFGMTLRLHHVQGPGQLTVFLQSGNFDDAQLLWTSDVTEPQDIWADANVHVHANWVFTEPGIYLLDVEALGELADGAQVSDRRVLRFAVGEDVDPDEAFEAVLAGQADATADDSTATDDAGASDGATGEAGDAAGTDGQSPGPDADSPADDAVDDDGGAVPVALLIGIGAGVLVLAAVVVSTMRSRRARRLAEEPDPAQEGSERA